MIRSPEEASERLGGLFNIAVTPFDEHGAVDYPAHRENIERVIQQGYDGVLVGGQYGEFATMSLDERAELARRTMEFVDGRVPVLLGAGGSEPAVVRTLVSQSSDLGAVPMVTMPYISETRDHHVLDFFAYVASFSRTGILIYNMPETGRIIAPDLLERLAEIDGIVGVKQGDLTPAVVDRIAGRLLGRLRVLASSDLHFLGPLMVGFHGATSTNSSALPELILKTFRAIMSGDASQARELHRSWYGLRELMREFGQPQTTKALMELRGWRGGHVRRPLLDLAGSQKSRLAAEFQQLMAKGAL